MPHAFFKLTAAQLAAKAAKMVKAGDCDNRTFDDCFEMGNGREVVCEFIRLYDKDQALQLATLQNERYIGIDQWRVTAAEVEAERQILPLFAQPAA